MQLAIGSTMGVAMYGQYSMPLYGLVWLQGMARYGQGMAWKWLQTWLGLAWEWFQVWLQRYGQGMASCTLARNGFRYGQGDGKVALGMARLGKGMVLGMAREWLGNGS